jgi:LmbE family N-acetylglucosaminyl deacetylase
VPIEYRSDAPTLVLSPHLDDAVLSAWSVLREPGEVVVANVCTAIPPAGTVGAYDRTKGANDSAAFMGERLAEDARALALADRGPPLDLGLLEDQYRDRPLSSDQVRERLEGALDGVAAICAPAGIGGNRDHVAAREAALEIGREQDAPVSLYADLPYAVRVGWPHWVTGASPRPHLVPEARWNEFLATASCGIESLEPRVRSLGEAEAALKLRALEAYRTQFANLNAGPLERLRNAEIIGFELHWEVGEAAG